MLKEKFITNYFSGKKQAKVLDYQRRPPGRENDNRPRVFQNYTSFIELNFLESPSLKSIFSGDLDVETLIANLSFAIKMLLSFPPIR